MKIAWLTEMNFKGKISKDYDNLKSDVALIGCSEGDNFCLYQPLYLDMFKNYDIIIINLTKAFVTNTHFINILDELKINSKIGIMQEKAINEWQDWDIKEQIEYLKIIKKAD